MDESLLPSLSLTIDEESGKLRAQFNPLDGAIAPDRATLVQTMQDQGFGAIYIDEKALTSFIDACHEARELVCMDIGERRDATFSLELSKDLMSAWLTVHLTEGAATDLGNPNLLVASNPGQPITFKGGVNVNLVIAVKSCFKDLLGRHMDLNGDDNGNARRSALAVRQRWP